MGTCKRLAAHHGDGMPPRHALLRRQGFSGHAGRCRGCCSVHPHLWNEAIAAHDAVAITRERPGIELEQHLHRVPKVNPVQRRHLVRCQWWRKGDVAVT